MLINLIDKSIRRKVIKHKIATKSQRHQDAQLILIFRECDEKQFYILDKTLCLCDFVAKNNFSKWTH